MPSNTLKQSIPYPIGTDVANFDLHTKNMADRLDERLSVYQNSGSWKQITDIAVYEEKNPNLTGYLIINTTIPANTMDKMFKITLRGYTYYPTMNIIDLTINWYSLSGGVFGPWAHNNGTFLFEVVALYQKSGTNTLSIVLSADSYANGGMWQYPKLAVDFETSYNGLLATSQTQGWSIIRTTSLTGYSIITGINSHKWQPLSLLNGWVNYGGAWQGARYRRQGQIVQVQGLVAAGLMIGDAIAQLPSGFRPAARHIFPADHSGIAGKGRVDVDNSGYIYHQGGDSNANFSLNSIVFPADGAF